MTREWAFQEKDSEDPGSCSVHQDNGHGGHNPGYRRNGESCRRVYSSRVRLRGVPEKTSRPLILKKPDLEAKLSPQGADQEG